MKFRVRGCAVSLALLAALTACSERKELPLQTKTVGEASSLVNEHFAGVMALIGADARPVGAPGVADVPCGDAPNSPRDEFGVSGHYVVEYAAERPGATIARLRQAWQDQGYRQDDYRTGDPERPELRVTSPADGVRISVYGVVQDQPRLLVNIGTPCYRAPAPVR